MDISTIGSNVYVIVGSIIAVLAFLIYLNTRPRQCKICGQPAKDRFITEGKTEDGIYCRSHVMQQFRKYFEAYTYPMVVFHPEQERRYCGTMYPFYTLKDLKLYNFGDQVVEKTKQLLESIHGTCQQCGKREATVGYFAKGVLQWKSNVPMVEDVVASPEMLCTRCCLQKIALSLQSNPHNYVDNGLLAPYSDGGVYVNTAL